MVLTLQADAKAADRIVADFQIPIQRQFVAIAASHRPDARRSNATASVPERTKIF